jgi:hypothetical protein
MRKRGANVRNSCAQDCLQSTLQMKAMSEQAAHDDAEKYAAREVAVRKMMDTLVGIAQDKFNIIIARDYGHDATHFSEASPSMGSFHVEYAQGEFDTFRIYLFTEGSYDRPMGPSWEKDGILWYPEFDADREIGCMYLNKFPTKAGMTEQERIDSADKEAEKEDGEKNHNLDEQAKLQTADKLAQQQRDEAAEASGVEPPTEDEPESESNAEQLENQGPPPEEELAPAVDPDLAENSAPAGDQAPAEDPEPSEEHEPEEPEPTEED